MPMGSDKKIWRKIRHMAGLFLFGSLLVSTAYSIVQLISGGVSVSESGAPGAVRKDYTLLLTQCALGMIVMTLPALIGRRWPLPIADFLFMLYYLFLFCAIFLGEVFSFYHHVPIWDSILHTFSGAMLCGLGFMLFDIGGQPARAQLSPFFVALMAFCFSMACGAVWEMYEFTIDAIMNLNMQKYMTEAGVALQGQAALLDTMKDIICNFAGALVCAVGNLVFTRRRARKEQTASADSIGVET
ncbi:MAG: hypothetical protein FWF69_05140 [Firmicutes bacterium]|nr:hypothetical protein [Bacillota bacterium]